MFLQSKSPARGDFAWLALRGRVRSLMIAAVTLAVFSSSAHALSASCDAINTTWQNVSAADTDRTYSAASFDPREVITHTLTDTMPSGNNRREATFSIFAGGPRLVRYYSTSLPRNANYTAGSAATAIEPARTGGNVRIWLENVMGGGVAVTVTCALRAVATEPGLFSLTSDPALTLQPAFASGTTSYVATVSNSTTSVTLTPALIDNLGSVTVNGSPVASGATSSAIVLAVGNNTITVIGTAEDGTTTRTYTLSVTRDNTPPPPPLGFSPASGALPDAMAGEVYSQTVTANGGANQVYSVASGTLPNGLGLNSTTGELGGSLVAGVEGTYNFRIAATDGVSNGHADYTLVVKPQTISATDKQITVNAGATPVPVNLTQGATGGPFTDAAVAFVEPANAGTAQIIRGEVAAAGPVELGWYLRFSPDPAFTGTARVGYRLTSGLGSASGTVSYVLAADLGAVAKEIDTKADAFVATRQGLLHSMIGMPGLLDRRAAQQASDPVSGNLSPTGDGVLMSFATSLIQSEAAHRAAGLVEAAPDQQQAFNAWISGALALHNRSANGNRWGSFAVVSLGADYLVADKVLIGLALHIDTMNDPTGLDTMIDGIGWLAGPYASVEIGDGVFLDASLLYGGSRNRIDTTFFDGNFDTTRWIADVSLSGQWVTDAGLAITPKLRAVYLSEKVSDYVVENAGGLALGIIGSETQQMRLSAGLDLQQSFHLDSGLTLTPKAGVSVGANALNGGSLFGTVSGGLALSGTGSWQLNGDLLWSTTSTAENALAARLGLSSGF